MEFGLGDFVNVFRRGSLVGKPIETGEATSSSGFIRVKMRLEKSSNYSLSELMDSSEHRQDLLQFSDDIETERQVSRR